MPSAIAKTFVRLLVSGELGAQLGITLARLSVGVALGGTLGLLLGFWLGWSRTAREIVSPVLAALHPLPKLSLLPLLLVIFGIGEQSKIVVIALAAFFPMLINTMAGVRQIDDLTWEVAEHFGARGWMLLRRVIVPGSLPMVLAGAQLALNSALSVTVAVELLSARRGLGATLWLAWQTLRTTELYVTILVIAVLGVVTSAVLGAVSRWFVPWAQKEVRSEH
jgi:NitT/TauT family transport system permease protein